MKRLISLTLVLAALLLALVVPAFADGSTFPSTIPLPNGWSPEGLSVGRGTTFFSGSIPTGSLFKGDLATGQGKVLVSFPPSAGRQAVGVYADARTNHVFVAGGFTGKAYVYDGDTGATLAIYPFAGALFVNDVVVTEFAAYFTDSFRPFIYKIPLAAGGELLPGAKVTQIHLGGDFVQTAGFNANGIEMAPGNAWLIIDSTAPGKLYRVDPATGIAKEIVLGGGGLAKGVPDGIRFVGNHLYVVENFLNRLAVVDLDPGFATGTVTGHIGVGDPRLHVPTAAAKFGDYLYVPNARFDIAPPVGIYPNVSFNIVQLTR